MGGLGAMNPFEDECVAMPDAGTLQVLPWDRRFAWMAADLAYGGSEPFALCPRSILKHQLGLAADQGLRFNLGVETEFYAFRALEDPTQPLVPMAQSGHLRPTPAYDIESTLDYEVFLISRVKELHDAGMDTVSATTHGLARTGRIVSTAAGLLAVSFFAFGTSRVSFIQLFGLGTGLAILLDATLVRGVLVPAVLAVAGERGWWAPRGLRRVYARVGLSEG